MSGSSAAVLASAARCLALDALAARTSALFTAAGIPHLLIKGQATCRWLYPDNPTVRSYSDVDMLVRADRFVDAQDLLRSNGYQCKQDGFRPSEISYHEVTWYSPSGDHLAVDLHRSFPGVGRATVYFDLLLASSDTLNVAGLSIAIPDQAATALIVAMHAVYPGFGRKPLADLRRALDFFDVTVWRKAADLARQCDAESNFRAGLGLLADGERLIDELAVGGAVAAGQWMAGRHWAKESVILARILDEPGTVTRLKYFSRKLLPSLAVISIEDPPALRGFPWLVAAYVRRLGAIAASTPRAVADVRAARRAIRTANAGPGVAPLRPMRQPTAVAVLVSRANRLVRQSDWLELRSAWWTVRSRESARTQLRLHGVRGLRLSAPPSSRPKDRRVAVRVLRAVGASCLERSVVLQRFDASTGVARAVVIGVTAPDVGFRAHAWLDGEAQGDAALREIIRHETPDACLGLSPG